MELAPEEKVLQNFEILSLGNAISRGFQDVFSAADTMFFHQNTCKTGNNAIEMSQAFHDIAQFKHFTDLNLFKYVFNVIQNREMKA